MVTRKSTDQGMQLLKFVKEDKFEKDKFAKEAMSHYLKKRASNKSLMRDPIKEGSSIEVRIPRNGSMQRLTLQPLSNSPAKNISPMRVKRSPRLKEWRTTNEGRGLQEQEIKALYRAKCEDLLIPETEELY